MTAVADGAGRRYSHDQTPQVDDELAASWIAAGHAEPYAPRRPGKGGGRQQATRTAPRNTAKKAAGATSSEAGKNADATETEPPPGDEDDAAGDN
ncbi:hypothetical protein [[Kitasatospora] papulosa]|uniref:hypothetical protein n=1 Tax=[Kitasatospora] papulosa TaxID=1464011 RepID=UPI0038269D63